MGRRRHLLPPPPRRSKRRYGYRKPRGYYSKVAKMERR